MVVLRRHTLCSSQGVGTIDHRKHDADVMERVLGLSNDAERERGHTMVVSIDSRPWVAGSTISEVQLTVGAVGDDEDDFPHGR